MQGAGPGHAVGGWTCSKPDERPSYVLPGDLRKHPRFLFSEKVLEMQWQPQGPKAYMTYGRLLSPENTPCSSVRWLRACPPLPPLGSCEHPHHGWPDEEWLYLLVLLAVLRSPRHVNVLLWVHCQHFDGFLVVFFF